jgi:hypothetical protein
MQLKSLPVGASGFDTSEQLTSDQWTKLVGTFGMKFGVRYVPFAGMNPKYSLQASELAGALATGAGLMLVQFSRTGGFSTQSGHDDGLTAAHYGLALGIPPGCCLWMDLSNAGGADATIAYANAWYAGAVEGGWYGSALGVYCEPGVPLTSSQLYHSLKVARYWKTAGICPDVQTRGYQMLQLYPGNRTIAPGILIDYDVVQSDYLASYPVAVYK